MTTNVSHHHQKTPLTYREGNDPPNPQIVKGKRLFIDYDSKRYEYDLKLFIISEVSIAALEKDGIKYAQYRVMSGCMAIPDNLCWFYVKFEYPWLIQTGARDFDRILTDGDVFFLVNRDLAQSPFVLNDFTKTLINKAIAKFTEQL